MNDRPDSDLLRGTAHRLRCFAKDHEIHGGFVVEAPARLESIATKYESMARAVLWAYDSWTVTDRESLTDYGNGYQDALATSIERATGKHPSDWTRDGLMKHLGIAQEADENE